MGDTRPVYHCKFALLSSHECHYCICNDCYEKKRKEEKKHKDQKMERSSRSSRTKRKRSSMYDDDEEEEIIQPTDGTSNISSLTVKRCTMMDHEVIKLKVCRDPGYFATEYVKKKLADNKGAYPTSCNECGKSYIG